MNCRAAWRHDLDREAHQAVHFAKSRQSPEDDTARRFRRERRRVGGAFRMSFRNFTTGDSQGFGVEYLELVPNERIRYTDRFDDPNLPGEIEVTVTLNKVSVGTELHIVQAGLPDVIPAEACHLGWRQSLENRARLVEPDIRS
jgi:uncharacterized protein YndB with AHSA1/START domain